MSGEMAKRKLVGRVKTAASDLRNSKWMAMRFGCQVLSVSRHAKGATATWCLCYYWRGQCYVEDTGEVKPGGLLTIPLRRTRVVYE